MCKVKAHPECLKSTKIILNFKLELLGRLNTVDFSEGNVLVSCCYFFECDSLQALLW